MKTTGVYEPETKEAAHEAYEEVGPTAQVVVKETAKALDFDSEEYETRVTGDVIETARDALFASLLTTYHGSREEFETWCADNSTYETDQIGGEKVESVVWHPVRFAETVVAATYQQEPEAAAATVRRRVFGRYYRPVF